MKRFLIAIVLLSPFGCNRSDISKQKMSGAHSDVFQKNALSNNSNREYWKSRISTNKFVSNAGNIGFWGLDSFQLPVFNLTANLPLHTFLSDGTRVRYPVDPWFLIGNYRLNCFVHASGGYQLLSMERAIARLNSTGRTDSAMCRAILKTPGDSISLIGLNAHAATRQQTVKTFGPGFAHFQYALNNGIVVRRTISTVPSKEINKGCSAFLINVEIENNGTDDVPISYTEGLDACSEMAVWNNPPFRNKRISYKTITTSNSKSRRIVARFIPDEEAPLVVGKDRQEHALADGFPPLLFLQAMPLNDFDINIKSQVVSYSKTSMDGTFKGTVPSHNKVRLSYIIGYLQEDGAYQINDLIEQLKGGISMPEDQVPFRNEWRQVIPTFANENDVTMRTELQWHVGTLESMANYSEYYNETYIPQGNLYEYGVGVSAAMNDITVHSLPLSFYNPSLAKSIMRYVLMY